MFGPHNPRTRLRALTAAACTAALGATLLGTAGTASAGAAPTTAQAAAPAAADATPTAAGDKVVGYFTNWGVYQRNYHVKNIEMSGSADKLTHINYAFGNVTGGKCAIGDSYADYDKAYTADQSVDGVADTWDKNQQGLGGHLLLGAQRRYHRRRADQGDQLTKGPRSGAGSRIGSPPRSVPHGMIRDGPTGRGSCGVPTPPEAAATRSGITDPHPLRSCGSRRTAQPARYGPGADHCGGPPTDNASYSDIVFSIFRILGHNFSPRFKDLDDQDECGPLGTAERQQAGEAIFGLEGVVVKQAAGLGVHRP